MIKILRLRLNNCDNNVFLHKRNFKIDFSTFSDVNDNKINKAIVFIDGHTFILHGNSQVLYCDFLKPFEEYTLTLTITDKNNDVDSKTVNVFTGNFELPLSGHWITDPLYTFKEKHVSPKVLNFKRNIQFTKDVKHVVIYASALGTYNLYINNKKVNDEYLLPGFTSYKHQIQYQRFNITDYIKNNTTINFYVAGGWAVGSYVMNRKNRITANKQALFAEIHIEYKDGTKQIIGTDENWFVTDNTKYLYADLYDGEGYDATFVDNDNNYHNATIAKLKFVPHLLPHYGTYNRVIKTIEPVVLSKNKNTLILDFKQNFAGFLTIKFNSKGSNKITIKHAEILNSNGDLNTSFLRTAKQQLVYISTDGANTYTPTFTYMGFRYVSIVVENISDLKVIGNVLSADVYHSGDFKCSNKLINRLQQNITWSALSNFIEIPTDCPQRDERLGWTGDIALFAPTAFFNFDVECFLYKWLKDLRSEQLKTGGLPNTIPSQGYGFPLTMPKLAVDFWGDASLLVPYAIYSYSGDTKVLAKSYESMKKYVDACYNWAKFLSFGNNRYIWKTPSTFHFGDWVSPDAKKMTTWQKRSVYTATCSLKNTSGLLSEFASLLGKNEDAYKYDLLSKKVSSAFNKKLTDGNGRTKKEFQTSYVLPLHFNMFSLENKKHALENLLSLVRKNNYCIGTGFPGTPYILFTLFDNGYEDDALKMLLNDKCPSWLYEVRVGATTIWERWDGLDENGNCPIKEDGTGGMISYNHYASGAVGDFLYKRIAGINALKPGYKEVVFTPYINKKYFTNLEAYTTTTYGKLGIKYEIKNDCLIVETIVPIGVDATLSILGKTYKLTNGKVVNTINL